MWQSDVCSVCPTPLGFTHRTHLERTLVHSLLSIQEMKRTFSAAISTLCSDGLYWGIPIWLILPRSLLGATQAIHGRNWAENSRLGGSVLEWASPIIFVSPNIKQLTAGRLGVQGRRNPPWFLFKLWSSTQNRHNHQHHHHHKLIIVNAIPVLYSLIRHTRWKQSWPRRPSGPEVLKLSTQQDPTHI